MGRYRERTTTFFTRFAYGLGRKQPPAIVPLSKSLGPPAPQTSLIFELPDELILSILSHISPDPEFIRYYARLRILYCEDTNDYQQRVRVILQLSMTCRIMWLRLTPWMWERLECMKLSPFWRSPRKLDAIMNALGADVSLATHVRFVTVYSMIINPSLARFVKCLESLPNLHTLEVGCGHSSMTTQLENALRGVELPQIKALILSSTLYALLRHCRNVEDVVWVVEYETTSSDVVLGSLATNQDSKVKRLTIPLFSWGNSSRYVAASPRLTELTLIYPFFGDPLVSEAGLPLDVVETTRSAALKLVNACKALPDFNTIQIVHIGGGPRPPAVGGYEQMRDGGLPPVEQRWQALRDRVKDVKDVAMDCLKECQEGEGRKRITLRVIELGRFRPPGKHRPGSMRVERVEEYEVGGFNV